MVKSTRLPFVIKGVLSRVEARKCLDCGVKGMVVSHHNGRIETAVPPLMVLPEIAEEMDGCEEIRVRRGEAEGEPETIYAGYTRLAGMTAGRTEGSMLITLERE